MAVVPSREALLEIAAALHDCPFDLEDDSFNRDPKSWTGAFLRPLWDDPEARHRGIPLLFVRSFLPVNRAVVRLLDVQDVQVTDRSEIGTYTFNELVETPEGIRLVFCEDMWIDFRLNSLRAEYEETREPHLRAEFSQVFLVQSGPKIRTAQ